MVRFLHTINVPKGYQKRQQAQCPAAQKSPKGVS
jgi:hypothetical protein